MHESIAIITHFIMVITLIIDYDNDDNNYNYNDNNGHDKKKNNILGLFWIISSKTLYYYCRPVSLVIALLAFVLLL